MQTSKRSFVTGIVLTTLAALFLAFDGVMKLASIAPVRASMIQLGYPVELAPILGAVLLACVALYIYARTAPIGAVLLTGYLGGAVSTHVRVGDPLLSHALFPVYMGVIVWGGLYLRDARVRALVGR
jgi:hypothetical protein